MNNPFNIGDQKEFVKSVSKDDIAAFDSGTVHQVYSTFALGRDAEWSCRLFVLEMKDENEEGIGTFLEVQHHSPAFIGNKVVFTSELLEVNGHEVICGFTAKVGDRLIADGRTGQKIIGKKKLSAVFEALEDGE